MKKLEPTPRDNVKVRYYSSQKNGKTIIKAQLTDEFGVNIDGVFAQHTLSPIDTEEIGKIAARTKALQKLDEMFRASDKAEETNYFSRCWNDLSKNEQKDCIASIHRKGKPQESALLYFENNVLPLLDRFGPDISADQAVMVVDDLYEGMLQKKKYNFCYVAREDTPCTDRFFEELISRLRKDQRKLRLIFGHRIDMDSVDALVLTVGSEVKKEDRLRSLVEFWLQDQKPAAAVKQFRKCVENDAVLIYVLDRQSKLDQAVQMLISILRRLSGNEKQTKNQVNIHVRDVNCILRNLCLKCNDDTMPVVVLPEYIVEKVPQIELCKELPGAVRRYFVLDCFNQVERNSYVCGGIVMLTTGPRVAEVCAIKFGDILDRGNWGICVINYTVDGDIRISDGKNIYFRRPIFFVKVAMDIIHRREEALRSQGYSNEQIATAYIVSRPDNPFLPARPHDFSVCIKQMLQEAGCGDDYWESVQQAMIDEPDFDFFRRPERYAIAYGLRRDATSMMCNEARMNPFLVDAILGHRLPHHAEEWRDKIKRDNEWPVVIAQMERVVYDPDHTLNPVFSAVQLGQSMGLQFNGIAYQGFLLSAPRKCKVTIAIRTVGNASVNYNLPESCLHEVSSVALVGTSGPHKGLSPLPPRDVFDKAKDQYKKKRE